MNTNMSCYNIISNASLVEVKCFYFDDDNDANNFFLVFAFLPHTSSDDIFVFVLVLCELRSSLDDINAFMSDDLSNYWFLKTL